MSTKFKTGDTIEIEFLETAFEDERVFKTLLEDSGDNTILVHCPIMNGRVVLSQVGERVKVSFSEIEEALGKYDIYTYKGKIVERKTVDNIAMIRIEQLSEIEKVQRRDYFRLNYVKSMQVVKDDMIKSVEVTSKDVSIGGMRFISEEKFEPNEIIVCHVKFEEKEVVSVRGRVIDSERTDLNRLEYQTRVKFDEVPSDKKSIMIRYINLIQSRMLKQAAGEKYQENIDSVLPQFSSEKLENYKDDMGFRMRMGYAKGVIMLMHILNVAIHFFARPHNNYPASQLLNIEQTGGWSPQFLQIGMGISIVLAIASVICSFVIYVHYAYKRIDKLLLFSIAFAILMFGINLYQFIVFAQ